MVRITAAAAFLAFVAISSATLSHVFDGETVAARADAPAAGTEDVKQLDTLIDAVATLQDMLKSLKQGTGGETQQDAGGEQKEDAVGEPKEDASAEPQQDAVGEPKEDASAEPQQDASAEPQQDASAEPQQDAVGEPKEDAA